MPPYAFLVIIVRFQCPKPVCIGDETQVRVYDDGVSTRFHGQFPDPLSGTGMVEADDAILAHDGDERLVLQSLDGDNLAAVRKKREHGTIPRAGQIYLLTHLIDGSEGTVVQETNQRRVCHGAGNLFFLLRQKVEKTEDIASFPQHAIPDGKNLVRMVGYKAFVIPPGLSALAVEHPCPGNLLSHQPLSGF